jgi:hypothetical protein
MKKFDLERKFDSLMISEWYLILEIEFVEEESKNA